MFGSVEFRTLVEKQIAEVQARAIKAPSMDELNKLKGGVKELGNLLDALKKRDGQDDGENLT